MKKQMEGDNLERRHRAAAARQAGHDASEEGVTLGGSKQTRHLQHGEEHAERIEDLPRGKSDQAHQRPQPKPGSV